MTTWQQLPMDLQRKVLHLCCEPTRDAWLQVSTGSMRLVQDVREQEACDRYQSQCSWQASPLPSLYCLQRKGCVQPNYTHIMRQVGSLKPNPQDLWSGWFQKASQWQLGLHRSSPQVWLNGLLIYQGDLYRHQPHGFGLARWCDGSWYLGHWHQGLFHGVGVYHWANQQGQYEGQWYLNQFHDKGTLYVGERISLTAHWLSSKSMAHACRGSHAALRTRVDLQRPWHVHHMQQDGTSGALRFDIDPLALLDTFDQPNDAHRAWPYIYPDNQAMFWYGLVLWNI